MKTNETEDSVKKTVKNPKALQELLAGALSKKPKTKFESAKMLKAISERKPETLYSEWRFFADLLDNENNILKWNALDIIANLTKVDSHDEFNKLFKKFYGYLFQGSLITASHVVDNSAKIVLSKPELQDEITRELLRVEEIPLPTEECRNIIIGKTIGAFQKFPERIKSKDEVVSFVRRHLNNSRNATRRKAEKFLKKLESRG